VYFYLALLCLFRQKKCTSVFLSWNFYPSVFYPKGKNTLVERIQCYNCMCTLGMYVWIFLTIEGFTMSATWRTAIKALFQYITINGIVQTLIRLYFHIPSSSLYVDHIKIIVDLKALGVRFSSLIFHTCFRQLKLSQMLFIFWLKFVRICFSNECCTYHLDKR
jgi:hypothetical protein